MIDTFYFSPELTVSDLLGQWPQTIPVLLRYRLDCIGCRMASFDTLEEVMHNYGLAWQSFEADLRSAIQES